MSVPGYSFAHVALWFVDNCCLTYNSSPLVPYLCAGPARACIPQTIRIDNTQSTNCLAVPPSCAADAQYAMVLLTMTPAIVDCLASTDDRAMIPGESGDPSLINPMVGNPILHSQILRLSRCQKTFRLEELLRGSQVYVAPPAPKPAKSPEYIALMAKLRRDEDARAYERMINPPIPLETYKDRFPDSARAFAAANKPTSDADIGDDDITYTEIHRQVTLLINFLVSIAGVAATLWILGRWWSVPARLFLTMGGSILVAIAEVAVYGGYVWRMGEAKRKEDTRPERREVVQSWVVVKGEASEAKDDDAVLLPEHPHVNESQLKRRVVKVQPTSS